MTSRISLWARFRAFLQRIFWFWKGKVLEAELEQPDSPLRSAAQLAVDRVVLETDITPDCVSALIFRGGEAIKVKHNEAWEIFIGLSYEHAADEAIEWLKRQGDEVKTGKVTKMNRQQRRKFDAERRASRRH
jgi:hypothetical protein